VSSTSRNVKLHLLTESLSTRRIWYNNKVHPNSNNVCHCTNTHLFSVSSELDAVLRRIREVNSVSPILQTQHSRVNLDLILSINAFDPQRAQEIDSLTAVTPTSGCSCHETENQDSTGDQKGHTHHHTHDTSVVTVTFSVQGEVTLEDFERWLGGMLWEPSNTLSIYRCKGMVNLKDEAEKYALQGVHTLFEVKPSGVKWSEGEQRRNKLVFIGKGLDRDKLLNSFMEACVNHA
jgi:G3E family GTPase